MLTCEMSVKRDEENTIQNQDMFCVRDPNQSKFMVFKQSSMVRGSARAKCHMIRLSSLGRNGKR